MLLPNVDAGAKPCDVGEELAPPPNGDAPNAPPPPDEVDAAPKPDGDDAAPNPPEPKAGAGAGAEPNGVEVPKAGAAWPKGLCGVLLWPNGDWGGFPPPAKGLLPPPPPNIAQEL